MIETEHLDNVRKRVEAADNWRDYGQIDPVITQSDCRYLLNLVDAQLKALQRATEFTELYEDRLLMGITENTLQYYRSILSGEA